MRRQCITKVVLYRLTDAMLENQNGVQSFFIQNIKGATSKCITVNTDVSFSCDEEGRSNWNYIGKLMVSIIFVLQIEEKFLKFYSV